MSPEIPKSWLEALFGDLNQFISCTIDPTNFSDEKFELYSVPSFPTRQPEIVTGAEVGSTKQLLQPDDVLVCKINPRINRVWQVGHKTKYRQIGSSEWIGFRAPYIDPRYFRYYFSSKDFRDVLCADVTGVGGSLTRAQPKKVATFSIPVAPLPEQKRIADKLDAVLARVDACRDHLDRIPAILKRFRQSVLAAATSGKLTEEWRVEHEHLIELAASNTDNKIDDHLANLPFGWQWTNIANATNNFDGRRVPVKASDREKRRGKYEYYGAFGAIDTIDDYLFDGEFLLLAEDGKNLESRDRPISLIANGKFWVNNHAHVLQPKFGVSIKYLNFWFSSLDIQPPGPSGPAAFYYPLIS